MKKIVVVEDEAILQELIVAELLRNNYEVFTASDGRAGWQLILKEKPDLILLDLLMPIMSGYDVLRQLRADPDLAELPCIVISNSGQTDDLNRAYEYGANDVLIKADFNPDQVVKKVEKLLEK